MTEHCDSLHAYVDGELDEAERAAFESHLATCTTCIAELPRLLALLAALASAADVIRRPRPDGARLAVIPGGATEPPAAANPAAPPAAASPPAPRPRRTWWIAGVGGALAAAAALAVFLSLPHPGPADPAGPALAALDAAIGTRRPIEPRVTVPGADRFRPLDVQRSAAPGATAPVRLLDLERELEQAGRWHAAAVVALLAGDREHAARAFAQAPPGPEVDADRAALALLDGDRASLERALEDVDRALAARPDLPAALWNRALVLAALDMPLAAADDFDRVRSLGEPGWADDAGRRAADLRRAVAGHRELWKRVVDAKRALIVDATPVPDEVAAAIPGYTTLIFYDAVRAAPSRAAVEALLPLARRLDAAYRSDHLTAYAQHIAAADFARRKPLADGYRRMLYGPAMSSAEVDAFLRRLERGDADDIRLGALVRAGRAGGELDTYRKLAAAADDPWFTALAEQETAAAEMKRGSVAAAERRLRGAIEAARRERLTYRVLALRDQLVKLYNSMQRLGPAADQARLELHEAAAAGEGLSEANALNDLIAIELNRYANGLARAYLTEQIERAQSTAAVGPTPFNDDYDCATRQYAFQSLAHLALDVFDPDRARDWLVRAPACGTADAVGLALQRALFAAELYRLGHRDGDARFARDSLAALARAELDPPARTFVELIRGNLLSEDDAEASRRHLRDAIAAADHRTDPHNLFVKARAYGFALLATGAGRAGDFAQVIDLVAEDLEVARPRRCAVAISHYAERTAVAYADARGEIAGRYTVRRTAAELDIPGLVPPDAIERLRACDRVAVMTRAPVLGAAHLLPPELAWSYVLGGSAAPGAAPGAAQTAPAGDASRLVVANPEAPPDLKLPPLNPYPADMARGATVLRGADATPTRVLQAMPDASVIEFHTHGFIGNDVTEASYLVLSPEPDRQYALTARDVAQVELARAPLVILGACHAAASSRSLEGGIGLAEAFLRSGARAVIASPDAVGDLGTAALFAAVRDRVMHGVDPAVALRDERLHRLSRSHDDAWVSGLVVFESPGTASM